MPNQTPCVSVNHMQHVKGSHTDGAAIELLYLAALEAAETQTTTTAAARRLTKFAGATASETAAVTAALHAINTGHPINAVARQLALNDGIDALADRAFTAYRRAHEAAMQPKCRWCAVGTTET